MQSVREAGITIAQDPASTKYDDKPSSFFETGCIDLPLESEQIGQHQAKTLYAPRDFVTDDSMMPSARAPFDLTALECAPPVPKDEMVVHMTCPIIRSWQVAPRVCGAGLLKHKVIFNPGIALESVFGAELGRVLQARMRTDNARRRFSAIPILSTATPVSPRWVCGFRCIQSRTRVPPV